MPAPDPPFLCLHCGWPVWPDDVWLPLVEHPGMVLCARCHDYIVDDMVPIASRLRRQVESVLRGIQIWSWS